MPHVLVVDDEPILRLLISRALISCGYRVDTAEDGAAAWQVLHADFSYDLLITDNNMPKLSGIELLKKLHAAQLSLPVILVSGAMPTEELHWHPWLRVDALLSKPFSTDDLIGTVKEVLLPPDEACSHSESAVHCSSQRAGGGFG